MVMLLVALFFILMFLSMPIAIALGASSLAYIAFQGYPVEVMIQRAFSMTQSFPLLAVPFFTLLGELAAHGGFVQRIIRLAKVLLGHFHGALGLIMVAGNILMAGISGSAVADAAALGAVLIPSMKEEGYDAGFSGALNAAASTIGCIIPPSVPMVIFGWITGVSVGQLFVGGAVPGVLIGLLMFGYVWLVAKKRGYPRTDKRPGFSEVMRVVGDASLAIIMPILVLISIIFGIATPTEVALLGAAYVLIVGMFIYRELSWADVIASLRNTAISTCVVMLVICMSGAFSWLLSYEHVGDMIGQGILSISQSPSMVLLIITGIMMVAGCFIDCTPNQLLFVPIFFPLITSLGIDPIHFGILFIVVLCIGLFTPPVGTTLFVSATISGVSMETISKEILPFLAICLGVALLILFIPELVLWLPRVIFG